MSVNLKSLAESLGLSQTTVSRGLNGYSDVSETTRARIKEAAKRLNYSPNARAKSLATGKTRTIGHIIPSSTQHEMVNPIFGDFVAGASAVYAEHGYSMLLSRVDNADEAEVYADIISSGKVDGILVQGPSVYDKRIERLIDLDVPFAVHGRSSGVEGSYDWVDTNNRRAFERSTSLLLDLGHRKIALLNGLPYMDFAERRRKGFLDAYNSAGIAPDADLIFSQEMTEGYGYSIANSLLKMEEPPTAFIASSLITALGVRRAIEGQGLSMGREVSVITHDDMLSYLPNGDNLPVFTATRSAVSEAGKILAKILIDRIEGNAAEQATRLLEAELVLGNSTGPNIS